MLHLLMYMCIYIVFIIYFDTRPYFLFLLELPYCWIYMYVYVLLSEF